MTLWSKDGSKLDEKLARFTVGRDVEWDNLLLPYDIEATRAHSWGLMSIGILTEDEYTRVSATLDALRQDFDNDVIRVETRDEDCHTVIEEYLTERLGDTGKRIHTGRSRNDQVLAALRLFLCDQLKFTARATVEVVEQLAQKAREYDRVLLPGYTHMQRAMPSTVALWSLGYAETFSTDLAILKSAHDRANLSPLGSAAGFGVPHLQLKRAEVGAHAGFDGVQTHATAVQLSRGKIELDVLHAFVQISATINRLASDLVLYSSAEFAFTDVDDAFTTGSSIMPQKRNPDVLELLRARHHRVAAELSMLLGLPSNLPSGYHRDLQLTKEAVMRGALECAECIEILTDLVPTLRFDPEKTTAAIEPDMLSTAFAIERAIHGVPFRDAYREWASRMRDGHVNVDTEEIFASYHLSGYPGKEKPDDILAKARTHLSWATA